MKLPEFICHDVLQRKPASKTQADNLCGRTLDGVFMDVMRPFEGHPVTLAILSEGLINNSECIEYIKSQPTWSPQCHGYIHRRYDVVSRDIFMSDMRKTQDLVEKHFGKRPTLYIPPFNQYSPETREMALSLGMEQREVYRKAGHYKKNLSKCIQVDFHYWSSKDMRMAYYALCYHIVSPHYIIGAPRSGTTALMRFLANAETIALKEKESLWSGKPRLREYYAKLLVYNDVSKIIDKNVRNSMRILELQETFPNAKFTHIIRDGRAAISSWRDWAVKTKKDDTSIEGAANQWVDYVTYILDNKHKLNNYEEVRYEEMCFKYGYFVTRNSKWKKRLTAEELDTTMQIAGPLMRDLGYV